jgi:sugar phosphate isomerase/epimerase
MTEYGFKVGISLPLGESPDTDEALHALIASSMDHVEIGYAPYCDDPAWTELVRKMIDSSPVNINSVHAPFSREVDISRLDDGGQEFAIQQIDKAIDVAERLGAGIVVLHGSAEPIEEHERARRIAQSRSSLSILSELAQVSGVRLALELLPRTCLGNAADELQMLLSDVPPEHAGFCLDTNHPADPEQLTGIVKQLGERIITLHVSDYDGIDERHWMPFSGVIDWGAFANALRDIQYSGAFVYETNPEGNTMEEKLENIQSNFERILTAAQSYKS